jgi:dTDP-4-dehydrorhamnose 3,5-epimerase
VQPRWVSQSRKFIRGAIRGVSVHDLRKLVDERGWVAEIYRHDELQKDYHPVMSYISSTQPGVMRGPHEHLEQTDLFCFIGPSNFKLRMWDNRPESETYNCMMTLFVGADNPKSVLVPNRIVHAYRNIGALPGIVISHPNRLYRGTGRRGQVDEIRHENDPETVFRMDE